MGGLHARTGWGGGGGVGGQAVNMNEGFARLTQMIRCDHFYKNNMSHEQFYFDSND